jgi:hypothetical protein
MWGGIPRKVSNSVTVNDRSYDQLNKSIDMARAVTKCGSKVHQFTERIHIEVERERLLEFTNIYRALEVDKLKPENDLGDISRRETRLCQFNERRVLRASNKVATKKSCLYSGCARPTRNVKNEVTFRGESLDHVAGHRRLPEVSV